MRRLLLLLPLFWFALALPVVAADVSTYGEAIRDFRTDIMVTEEGTVRVTETIRYNFGNEQRHGILRNIPLAPPPGVDGDLSIRGIYVTDDEGNYYPTQVTGDDAPTLRPAPHNTFLSGLKEFFIGRSLVFDGDEPSHEVNIRVGDPDVTITGEHTYVVRYEVENAIGRFEDRDEIYWNTTGNDWQIPIGQAFSTVILPGNQLSNLKVASYCGFSNDSHACIATSTYGTTTDTTIISFASPDTDILYSGQGMTVAVGFPKGIVAPPSGQPVPQAAKLTGLLKVLSDTWFYPVPFLLTAWFMRKRVAYVRRRLAFYKKNLVVVEYDTDLTPLAASTLAANGPCDKDLSAEIIWLAVHGYLIIKKEKNEYHFIDTGKARDLLSSYDRQLLGGVVGKTESDLTLHFYMTAKHIEGDVFSLLKSESYLESEMRRNMGIGASLSGLFVAFFLVINPGVFVWFFLGVKIAYIFAATLILNSFVTAMVGLGTNRLTQKGLEAERKLLGLKRYIDMAEKERIKFHNAPAKTPEVFEKLLPFAMIFGLEKEWAKEFKDIYTSPPSWYQDDSLSTFSSVALVSHLNSFSTSSVSALTSSPHVSSGSSGSFSGSSGGGSSGGGGGGGGGGSW